MSVNYQPALKRAFQEVNTTTLKAFDAAPSLWRQFVTEVPSRSRSSLFAWLANQATVREWKGPRIAHDMATRTWEVMARKWELTFKFTRDQIEDDLEGLGEQAVMQAHDLGKKFAKHEDLLVAQTLVKGLTGNCWDGQYFFDTDHPIDVDGITSGTYSNLFTLALNHANFRTVLTAMLSLQNEDGTPLIIGDELILMVPTGLMLEGQGVVESPELTPATSYGLYGTGGMSKNPYYGRARLVVNPFLTDQTRWYLMSVGDYIKPLIMLRRRPLEITQTDETALIWFQEEKWYIGGSARYECSFALPQYAFTSKP